MSVSGDHYFVEIQHRPRRVAFLVDVDQSSDALFDEIVDFNVSTWGGRYNPVIPVVDGEIPESYWHLLQIVNPDLLYTYCDLSASTVVRILADIRPLDVRKHTENHFPENMKFRVGIDHQATVLAVLQRTTNQLFARTPRPEHAILIFDYKDVQRLSSFVLRNFGENENIQIWCRDHNIRSIVLPPTDSDVMNGLATNRILVPPIITCADSPRKLRAVVNQPSASLTLCYGSSAWNFVEYWNLAHFDGVPINPWKAIAEMWVPPSLLEDDLAYKALIALIRRRTSTGGLRMVSYDEGPERLREITQRICADSKFALQPLEPTSRNKGELPPFESRGVVSFYPPLIRPQSKQVSGNNSYIELEPPADIPGDHGELWIADLAVENSSQERYIANRVAWWKLPRKSQIARLFMPHSPCRIGNDHLVSAEISEQQQGVLVKIPQLATLFDALVLPTLPTDWVQRLSPAATQNFGMNYHTQTSDKGMYARGVLGLFESLQDAAYVFEHDFWRGVVESLSSPVGSDKVRQKIRSDFERMGVDTLKSDSMLDLIVDEVLDAAGHIQRPTQYINFDGLFDRYWKYLKALPTDEERIGEVMQANPREMILADDRSLRNAAHNNLRDILSALTARKLFFVGVEVQCENCLASLWYHVDDIRSVVTCRGCRKEVNFPAERPWSYALNELVVSAVRDHGVVPVIRTAYRLFEKSRECFCFLPGIEIRDYNTGSQVCELDLVWILDGEFGVAEIKRTPKKFAFRKKLAMILNAALPNRFLLVGTTGTNAQMQEARSQIAPQIDSGITVEAWDPVIFERPSHPGWKAIRYSF